MEEAERGMMGEPGKMGEPGGEADDASCTSPATVALRAGEHGERGGRPV